jgi:glucose-1-phosphate adenylyltransferase
MNNVMSVLFASGNENKLNELTIHRTTASLPFGGRYRLIDFTLSNLVNSGITTIGLITLSNYSSLMDHIRMGRDWDLNRKNSGIAVFPPYVLNTARDVYKGKIEAIYTIMDFLRKAKEDYVVVSNCNIAANIDFEKVFDNHQTVGADVTLLCCKGVTTTSKRMVVTRGADGFATDLYMSEAQSAQEKMISLNCYLLNKELLLSLVEEAYARGHVDFEKDILMKMVGSSKLYAYEIDNYAAIVDDVKTYFNESMKLLDADVRKVLFNDERKIYTKVKDSVPTVYQDGASVKNSLIADGCVIDGTVENSILFRNVHVSHGAVVKNSIVMEGGTLEKNAKLSYTITDKGVTITAGKSIAGYQTYPLVIVKNKTI